MSESTPSSDEEKQEQVGIEPETIEPEPETPETPPADEQPPQEEPAKPEADLARDYAESTREAQILLERNKQIDAKLADLTTNAPPTDEELQREFPEWNTLDDYNKRVLRRQYATEKRAIATQKIVMDLKEERDWNNDYARVLRTTPALVGREDEFKKYAYMPTHKNVALDILVDSFLYKIRDKTAPSQPRRTGLEPGSGGPKTPPASNKISLEQASLLRKNNYREYMRVLKAGLIDDTI